MKKPVPQTQAKPGTAAAKLKKAKFSPEAQAKWKIIERHMLEWVTSEKSKTLIVAPTPKFDEFIAFIMGDLFFGKPSEADRRFYGESLLLDIETLSPKDLEARFSTIVAMKRKAIAARAGEGHKNARYANLLARFKKITGRMPFSLVEFWGYVKEKKVEFPKNRTRINKQIGIAHLPQRHRKKE
jgi:hypothetical protein